MKTELQADLVALLVEIRDEVRNLRHDLALRQPAATVDPSLRALLHDNHAFLGTACHFSAGELLREADSDLRKALGDIDARQLGRAR